MQSIDQEGIAEVEVIGPKGQKMLVVVSSNANGVFIEVQAADTDNNGDRIPIGTIDVSWEDFAAEVGAHRDEDDATTRETLDASTDDDGIEQRYLCAVMFVADGECYGTERPKVLARSSAEAKRLALKATDDSHYADDRIDFRREVYISGVEDIDDEDFEDEDEDDATDEEQ